MTSRKIGSLDRDLKQDPRFNDNSFTMQVPDKIVVLVGETGNVGYRQGQYNDDNDLISFVPDQINIDPVALTTPPRVLTLSDRNLDAEDYIPDDPIETELFKENKTNIKEDSQSSLSSQNHLDNNVISSEGIPGPVDNVTLLRRQVFKLHRRITNIERNQVEKNSKDMYMYAVAAALFLFNGIFLYRNRKWL